MGRPKVKIIDDSQPVAEIKERRTKNKNEPSVALNSSSVIPSVTEGSSMVGEDSYTTFQSDKAEVQNDRRQSQDDKNDDKIKKNTKPGKNKPRSKKYQEMLQNLDKSKTYPLSEAVELVKKLSYSKFAGKLAAHINTVQTGIRGLVALPFASGKTLKILVFGKSLDSPPAVIPSGTRNLPSSEDPSLASLPPRIDRVETGRGRSGLIAQDDTIITGDDETIEQINKGKVDFDLVVTTPAWMPKLAKVARILGPRGLMPNPKNGTITGPTVQDLKKAVEGFQTGKTEYEHSSKMIYKTEAKAPIIHIMLGSLSQPTEELVSNVKALVQTVGKTKIKKITLAPTMGPGVKIDLTSV